jgi:hypothetical protein
MMSTKGEKGSTLFFRQRAIWLLCSRPNDRQWRDAICAFFS